MKILNPVYKQTVFCVEYSPSTHNMLERYMFGTNNMYMYTPQSKQTCKLN